MKKLIEKYNNIFDTKRKKALLRLGFWVIFFIIVVNLIGRPPKNFSSQVIKDESSSKNLSSNSIDNFKNMDNFEFSYEIVLKKNDAVKTIVLDGTYFDKKYYFNMDNKKYYGLDGIIYYVNEETKQLTDVKGILNNGIFNIIDINILFKDSLYTIIDSSSIDSTTSYKDGTEINKYTFVTSDNKKIIIASNSSGKLINTIELDLTNYIDIKYDSVKVNCNYKNINNISDYKINYDEYQVIKKEGE